MAKALIVIDPAGNAHNPGRKLSDSFERGATMQCAELLKKELEQSYDIQVVLTHTIGNSSTQEQNAQIANRLAANIYLHISFFHETEVKPNLFLYTFSYDNDFPIKKDPFLLCPYNQAHCLSLSTTAHYAQAFFTILTHSPYTVHPVIKIPYMPLKGITVPAFGIEIGLHTTRDWRECVSILAQSIGTLCQEVAL